MVRQPILDYRNCPVIVDRTLRTITLYWQLVCLFNPFMPSGLFYLDSLDRSISYIRGIWLVFIIVMFCKKILKLMANHVDPDQTPRYAVFDLHLHCLPVSLLWDARCQWVNVLHVG